MAGVFIRGKGRRFRHTGTYTQERRPCEDGGRDWSEAATNQGSLGNARSHQRLGTREEPFFPRDFRGNVALPTLHLGLLASRTVRE